MDKKNPRVFISFAHESDEHRAIVRKLADWLTDHGVETITDHPYVDRPPPIGWPAWMQHSIEDASIVLVVCSPHLKLRYEKREEPGIGRGATFEGAIVTQEMYDNGQINTKSYPILPDGGLYEHIPVTLRPFDAGHFFPSGNDRILRLITDEVVVPKPKRPFERVPPGQLRGADDNRLTPRETRVFGREAEIRRVVDFLLGTEGNELPCYHVTGTAGIGKTEVCKAALREYLASGESHRAFYVDIADGATADELSQSIARALGADTVAKFDELRPLLREGLYYLDNLEGVAETAEGRTLIQRLCQQPGVRVLASSRVSLPAELGRPALIEALPQDSAVALFCSLWTGERALSDDVELRRFVADDLGCHPLSIALTARLGESYGLPTLVQKWKAKGTVLAADPISPNTRLGSLTVSIGLTADSLAHHRGTLLLWTAASLFPNGIPEEVLSSIELSASAPDAARQRLTRHHVWTLRDDRFYILPPVARYALDNAAEERDGFSWDKVRPHAFGQFSTMASQADSTSSTGPALDARRLVLASFDAISRFLMLEMKQRSPQADLLAQLNASLLNWYQFRPVQGREVLRVLRFHLDNPADSIKVLADVELRLGEVKEAQRLYGEALELFRREQNASGQASVLRPVGDIERRLGHPEQAHRLYSEALTLYQLEGEILGQANTLKCLGNLFLPMGKLNEAQKSYQQALVLYRQTNSGLGQAGALHSLGEIERGFKRFDKARSLYYEALELYKIEMYGQASANVLISLGSLELQLENRDEAQRKFNEALSLYIEENDRLGQGNALRLLGDTEQQLGRTDEARQLYADAFAIYEREMATLGSGNTYKSLGDLEHKLGNMMPSLKCYEEAVAIAEAEHNPILAAYAHAGAARCHQVLGKEADRDRALVAAFFAAYRAGFGAVPDYVFSVLVELTGSSQSAQAWIQRQASSPGAGSSQ